MRPRDNRLVRVRRAIDASPVRSGILNEAYEWFTSFGELSDDDNVAYEVVQKAMRGGEDAPPNDEATLAERVRSARLTYQQRERPGETWPPTVRALLFDEALFEPEPLRRLARGTIAVEVAYGGDVESPGFASRHGIPMFGSVAMHVHGWPRNLVTPPYELQAKRLLARLDNVRGRIPQDDPRWFEAQAEATLAFQLRGELPDDDLHLEMLLVDTELGLLAAHKRGKNVEQALRLLDQAAQTTGAELEVCLTKLTELAKARLL